eukprot:50941-Eustigmatos_ZCMA.PRE.1
MGRGSRSRGPPSSFSSSDIDSVTRSRTSSSSSLSERCSSTMIDGRSEGTLTANLASVLTAAARTTLFSSITRL